MEEEDLYIILGASIESTKEELKKAYRKKALKCHPDKHPDNPKAAEIFQKLTMALDHLTDDEKRKSYDGKIRAKMEREVRLSKQNSLIRKMREDLEKKEKAAAEARAAGDTSPASSVAGAGFPLRRSSSKFFVDLEQSQQKAETNKKIELTRIETNEMLNELKKAGQLQRRGSGLTTTPEPPTPDDTHKDRTIKVKWKKRKSVGGDDESEAEDAIRSHFRTFGRIAHVVIKARKRKAFVVFDQPHEAVAAGIEKEQNDFTVGLLSRGKSQKFKSAETERVRSAEKTPKAKPNPFFVSEARATLFASPSSSSPYSSPLPSFASSRTSTPTPTPPRVVSHEDHHDYETQTFARLKAFVKRNSSSNLTSSGSPASGGPAAMGAAVDVGVDGVSPEGGAASVPVVVPAVV